MARRAVSFSVAAWFLPPARRDAVETLYLYCRTADDLADDPTIGDQEALKGLEAMANWVTPLPNASEAATSFPGRFWRLLGDRDLDSRLPLCLIDGVRSDRVVRERENWDDLQLYCFQVAGSVGMLIAQAMGARDADTLAHAATLGVAMQLTNILRDVGEDLDRGIVYLPTSELARYGYDRARLERRVVDADFVRLLRAHIARARTYYDTGMAGIHRLPAEARFGFALAGRLYGAILSQIEVNGFDVFRQRAVTTRRRKAWIVASTYLDARLGNRKLEGVHRGSPEVLDTVAATARLALDRTRDQIVARSR